YNNNFVQLLIVRWQNEPKPRPEEIDQRASSLPTCSPDFPAHSAQDANIDIRRKPFAERKAMLRKVLRRTGTGIQYVEHTEGEGAEMFEAVCKLGLEGNGFKEAHRAISLETVEKLVANGNPCFAHVQATSTRFLQRQR